MNKVWYSPFSNDTKHVELLLKTKIILENSLNEYREGPSGLPKSLSTIYNLPPPSGGFTILFLVLTYYPLAPCRLLDPPLPPPTPFYVLRLTRSCAIVNPFAGAVTLFGNNFNMFNRASKDKISDIGEGSPNSLLYVGHDSAE